MIGGYNELKILNTIERFDPRIGKCEQVAARMNECRCYASSDEHNGMIYVTGGWGGENYLDTVEMFEFDCRLTCKQQKYASKMLNSHT